MAVPHETLTLEQFLKLPEEKPALEYEDGRITQKVSPKGKHSGLQGEFVEQINRAGRPKRIARAFPELRTTFAGRSYVPDVAVYLWSRISWDARGEIANEFFEPPDIAIEIVSPEQSVSSLVRKCLWYVAHGVRVALLVDPPDHVIFVFRPNQVPQAMEGAEQIVLTDVISELTFTVSELFEQALGMS